MQKIYKIFTNCKPRILIHINYMHIRSLFTRIHILALDAPLIGLAWQQYFAHTYEIDIALSKEGTILVASLWLAYMADRLFDIQGKSPNRLKSKRHQFAQRNRQNLWLIWTIVLAASIAYSLSTLNSDKIVACLILFFLILLYNLANQCLWKKGFPKEVCVASLFSLACFVLLDVGFLFYDFFNLGLIIFLNCILLSKKEEFTDQRMGFYSLAQSLNSHTITGLIIVSLVYFAVALPSYLNPFFLLSLSLLILHVLSLKCLSSSDEGYRFLLECLYFIIPLLFIT